MKKLCVFFLFIIICISGCSNEVKTPTVNTDFSSNFSATYKDISIKGKIVHNRQGVTSISITSPNTVDGLNVTFKNNQIIIDRENLECTADESYLPSNSFPNLLSTVLDEAKGENLKLFVDNDNSNTYSLNTSNNKECSIVVNKKGFIEKVDIVNEKFSITFSNPKQIK